MGLAASQAKLLSITTRLSDNELRSQSITAAKLALASQSSEASRKYINALNTNEFIYRTYDEMGNKVYKALTGSILTTYGPLKNQYALINTAGQILISELDAANYESSKDINEFLSKYGIDAIPTGETRKVTNPAYAPAYEQWQEDYNNWKENYPKVEDYTTQVPDEDNELYNKFIEAVTLCRCWAGEGSKVGFSHVEHIMAKMLDYDTDFVAYPGTDREVTYHKIAMTGTNAYGAAAQGGSLTQGNNWYQESENIMIEVRDKIKNNEHDPDLWQDIVNLYYEAVKTGGYLSYINSVDNGYPAMTTEEIDTEFYDANEADGNDSIVERLKASFMKDETDWDAYNEAVENYGPAPELDVPATIDEEIYEYSDKDKAQWYVNLWHRINGPSQEKDGTEELVTTSAETDESGNYTSTKITTTTTTRNRYDILEDGLMNSQDWLKYALETGAVSLERVNFAEQTEDNTGLLKAEWTSIIYNNALDISEQTNERKIAQAEAEYEQKQREIENKDKQYDSMLKLLDTEHNALQTEYDSIKSVISKNTERTLKIYSA